MSQVDPAVDFDRVEEFTTVDHAPDPRFLVRIMEVARAQPGHRGCRVEVLDQLRLSPGTSAIDVGCGFGADAAEMAADVTPGGTVVGVDNSEVMLATARERHHDPGLSFQFGDAVSLPFPDATFDGCRFATVLAHVPGPERAVAEMARVVKPGGRVAGFELDMDTIVVDSPYRDVTRAFVRSFGDLMDASWLGRQLPGLYREAGLTDLTSTPRAVTIRFDLFQVLCRTHLEQMCASGALDQEEAERWWSDLRTAADEGRFTAAMYAFVAAGTRR